MKKAMLTLSSALMATSILAGCGAANKNGVNNNAMGPRQVGYHTDNNRNNGKGYNNLSYNNGTTPNNNMANNTNTAYDTDLARRIQSHVTRLSGVRDSSVLLNGNTVIVGVDSTTNNTNTQGLEEKVRSTVNRLAPDKKVQIVTNQAMVRRISDVNNRLDTGSAYREVRSDINGILNDLGDAIQRPFVNNAK